MSWFRLDDKFHSHTKIIAAGNAAVGLFVRAGCYCSDHSTDGLVTFPVAALLGKPREAQALCDAGLWVKTDDGYQIPDYLDFNPSREQVEAQRAERSAAKAKAGKIGGVASGRSRNEAKSKQERSKVEANVKQNEAPSRPVPTPTNKSSSQLQVRDVDNPTTTAIGRRVEAAVDYHALQSAVKADNPNAYAATVRANTWAEYGPALRAEAEANPEATDADLVRSVIFGINSSKPVHEAWYPNPHCETCDGTGLRVVDDGGAGTGYPCDCRRPEPYLATVTDIRAAVG